MRRPWNITDNAVYSLATYNGERVNMNICTYVSAISMQPKLYAVAVYNNTQSLENILQADKAVLQILHPSQYRLVNNLGKRSGKNFDKHSFLDKKKLLTDWNGFAVLQNTSALLLLKKINHQQTGDHVLFIFEVEKYSSFHPDVLTVSVLRDKKIIRA